MSIVGFGDFLMHFSPHDNDRFLQTPSMDISFTGAEANVCAALGFWKETVIFITKLPEHNLALKGIMFLNSFNINTDYIIYGEGRMGLYFLEKGHSIRPSAVIYDRSDSVFANSKFEDYNWEEILENASAFYLSGITPSLSDSLLDCCQKVLKLARKRQIPVFYDVNLRPTICDIKHSQTVFATLSPYITHLISNEEHLKQLLEIDVSPTEDASRLLALTKNVQQKTNIHNIAVTVRRTPSANKAIIYASYYNGTDFAISNSFNIDVVDRVGSGDSFSAGIVYSVLHGRSVKDTVDFSIVSSALKHTINNDINFSSRKEIKSIMYNKTNDVRR